MLAVVAVEHIQLELALVVLVVVEMVRLTTIIMEVLAEQTQAVVEAAVDRSQELAAQESSFSAGHKINTKRLHSCQ
jgi:hypothetical protein